jgi:serine/threonine protein kinase
VHPNVVNCFGIKKSSHDDGDIEVLLLLEYCSGGTLTNLVQSAQLSLKEILICFTNIVDGVAFLHSHNPAVIHADLCPDNILLHGNGNFKIADFGCVHTGPIEIHSSRDLFTVQNKYDRVTDASYRSPETLNSKSQNLRLGTAMDIWSLGCIFYFMLYRSNLFENKQQILKGSIQFPSSPSYPKLVKSFVQKLVELDPSKRPTIHQVQKMIRFLVQQITQKDVEEIKLYDAVTSSMNTQDPSPISPSSQSRKAGIKSVSTLSPQIMRAFGYEQNPFQRFVMSSQFVPDFSQPDVKGVDNVSSPVAFDSALTSFSEINKPSNVKDLDHFIAKAINSDLTIPKPKYVRKLVIAAWESSGLPYFFYSVFKMPLNKNLILAYKALQTVHKLILEGPPEIITQANQYRPLLKSLIYESWKEKKSTDALASYVCDYTRFLDQKIRFHVEHSIFEGNLAMGVYLSKLKESNFVLISPDTMKQYFFDLMADLRPILKIGKALVEFCIIVSKGDASGSIGPEHSEFMQGLLIPCVDEALSLYHSSTFLMGIISEFKTCIAQEQLVEVLGAYKSFFIVLEKLFQKIKFVSIVSELRKVPELPRTLPKLCFDSLITPLPSNLSNIGIINPNLCEAFVKHLKSFIPDEKKAKKSASKETNSSKAVDNTLSNINVPSLESNDFALFDQMNQSSTTTPTPDPFEAVFKDAFATSTNASPSAARIPSPDGVMKSPADGVKPVLHISEQIPNPPEPDYLVQQIWGQLLNDSKMSHNFQSKKTDAVDDSKKHQQLSKSFVERASQKNDGNFEALKIGPRSKSLVLPKGEEDDRITGVQEISNNVLKHLEEYDPLELDALDIKSTEDENPFSELDKGQSEEIKQVNTASDEIDIEEIEFKERIGIGGFAEVFKAEWRGTEVAVKKLLPMKQTKESVCEFKAEVDMMRRLRHPNIVMFMGAVTKPPDICLVTELLQMSLFDLLHNTKVKLTWKIRFKIAIDTAIGMNFLHLSKPPIIHRDLVSVSL